MLSEVNPVNEKRDCLVSIYRSVVYEDGTGKGKDDPTIFLDCYCQWHAVMYACVRIMDTQKERLHDNE